MIIHHLCLVLSTVGFIFSVKSHNVLVRHLKLQTNHEDFELRKLLINILVVLSKDRTVVSVSMLFYQRKFYFGWI